MDACLLWAAAKLEVDRLHISMTPLNEPRFSFD
jgi:hypothetical protein